MPTFKGASSLGHLNRQSKARKLAQPEFCRARFGETENRTFSGITRKKGCRKKGRRRNGEKETVGSEIDEWLFFSCKRSRIVSLGRNKSELGHKTVDCRWRHTRQHTFTDDVTGCLTISSNGVPSSLRWVARLCNPDGRELGLEISNALFYEQKRAFKASPHPWSTGSSP